MGLFLIILAFSPLWIMAFQAGLTRLGLRRFSGQVTAMLACAAAAVPIGGALWAVYLKGLSGQTLWSASLYGALVYALLAYSYFHLFNMGETARRVRVLVELRERSAMSVEALISLYNAGAMLDKRLERLIALGQVRVEGGRIVLSSRRLYWAAVLMNFWCRFLGLPPLRGLNEHGRRS